MDIGTIANIATAVAVIVAIVFGVGELRQTRRQRRDQAAIEIMRAIQAQGVYEAAAQILKLPEDVDPAVVRDSAELTHAAQLIHYTCEMFGSLVFEDVVDLHVLDRMIGGWVTDCWGRLRRWTEAERVAQRQPNIGEWWQWLVERLEADPEPSKVVGAHNFYRGRARR